MGDEEIPLGIYIDLNGLGSDRYNSLDGSCYVKVYRSLDFGHGNPPVEHVVKLGAKQLPNLDNMDARQFLEALRGSIKEILGE